MFGGVAVVVEFDVSGRGKGPEAVLFQGGGICRGAGAAGGGVAN